MCGINLIYAYRSRGPVDPAELVRTRDAMRTRGPDAAGQWISDDGRIGLGHRRLSIIDTSHDADQPMLSADRRYAIVFNGEIYNHVALRAELAAGGERFSTHSDTEVLLVLYARYGAAMIERLRGMFVFCIWDALERRVFMARDPFGIKPLYYSNRDGVLRVASQVKALLAGGVVSRAVDPAGICGFLVRGTVPQPLTTHEDVRALPAGSFAFIDNDGSIDITQYFSIAELWRDGVRRSRDVRREEWGEIVREAVADSVRDHLVADVPVGAFLSAGKDSSTVVALAAEAGFRDLTTLTIGCREFVGTMYDEVPLARDVADHYGLRHYVRTLGRKEFLSGVPRIVEAMDQPSIDGFNTYFVAKAAAELGMKVMLSGTGGDELFGGYSTFRKIPSVVRIARAAAKVPGLARGFRRAYGALAGKKASPKSASTLLYCRSYEGAYLLKRGLFLPEELPRILPRDMVEEGLRRLDVLAYVREAITPDPGTPFARVAALESAYFLRDQLLRDIDWASMAHSVEVRVPLVDLKLLRAIVPVLCAAQDHEKLLLASAPRKPLPAKVLAKPKTGFLLPIPEWTRPMRKPPHTFGMRSFAVEVTESLLGLSS